jgi:hypothetical protein
LLPDGEERDDVLFAWIILSFPESSLTEVASSTRIRLRLRSEAVAALFKCFAKGPKLREPAAPVAQTHVHNKPLQRLSFWHLPTSLAFRKTSLCDPKFEVGIFE